MMYQWAKRPDLTSRAGAVLAGVGWRPHNCCDGLGVESAAEIAITDA